MKDKFYYDPILGLQYIYNPIKQNLSHKDCKNIETHLKEQWENIGD